MKRFKMIAITALVAISAVACGRNGGGGTSGRVSQTTVPGCPTCGANTILASGLGEMTYYGGPGLELGLQFHGDPQILGNQAGGYYIGDYVGPVIAKGKMLVKVHYQSCGVPAGSYTVENTRAGQWGNQYMFQGIQMVAKGPVQVQILISGFLDGVIPAARGWDGTQYPYRLQARMQMYGPQGYMVCDQLMY
jgi:hypothetical protein